MRLSLDWLQDYVHTTLSPEVLADTLVMTAAEVEESIEPPLPLTEAVVATITDIAPHPQADRLRLATIRVGKQTHTVVCGAPNIAVGQKVPYIGTSCHYHADTGYEVLHEATIRGVVSAGMLGSARDLAFGSNHDGILVLPDTAKEGSTVASVLGWELPTLDLEITPNRGDLLSYIGLAREVAAIERSRLTMPPIHTLPTSSRNSAISLSVETALCSRYTGTLITGITNGPSPLWMQARLLAHDINPQNAIVDITNYVMLELGQPLHAFDAATLRAFGELRITVRTAARNEEFTGLDSRAYQLNENDIVIDANGVPVALAGVIGGAASAVSLETTEIVLESAQFDPVAVRKTANRHSCRTDAVTRFEKEIDPEMTVVAVKRVVQLIKEICGGEVSGGLADANYQHATRQQIDVSLDRATRILGTSYTPTEAKSLLSKIGFGVSLKGKHEISVLVPSWRHDVTQEEDIFEELIRLGGYDQIQATLPSGPLCTSVQPVVYTALSRARDWLARSGLRELESQAFATDKQVTTYFTSPHKPVTIANPTTKYEAYYRFSLLPHSIERACAQSRTETRLASFEIGDVATHSKEQIHEETNLGMCMLTDSPVQTAQQIKGMIVALPQAMERTGTLTFAQAKKAWPFFAATPEEIRLNGKVIGQLGVVSRSVTDRNKLRGERYVVAAELTLTNLIGATPAAMRYQPPHKYPVVYRDITVALDQKTPVRTVIDRANDSRPDIVHALDVIDYHPTANGPRVTIRVTLYGDTTLTDAAVTAAVEKINQLVHHTS